MLNPNTLKVGDRIRFTSLPDEWSKPGHGIHPDSISFMKRMLKRATPVRVTMIDEIGIPWIDAVTIERGKRHYHSWAITEKTGWRKIVPRKRRKAKTD
jgi:hypothetical protein